MARPARPLPVERSWRFGIGLGYGERTNPLVLSEDIPVIVDLDIAWFGKRWFFDNFDLGFQLADNRLFTANAVARVNSDRVFFGKTNIRYVNFTIAAGGDKVPIAGPPPPPGRPDDGPSAGDDPQELKVPDRDYAIEMGLEMLFGGEWGQATLRAFHDVSQTHEGFEISADYSYRWTLGRFSVFARLSVSPTRATTLSNYYWGVNPEEAGLTLVSRMKPKAASTGKSGFAPATTSRRACGWRSRRTTSACTTASPRARSSPKTTSSAISPEWPGNSDAHLAHIAGGNLACGAHRDGRRASARAPHREASVVRRGQGCGHPATCCSTFAGRALFPASTA